MTADQIKKDIDGLFGNTKVPASQTRSDLEDIASHIDILLDTLKLEDEDD